MSCLLSLALASLPRYNYSRFLNAESQKGKLERVEAAGQSMHFPLDCSPFSQVGDENGDSAAGDTGTTTGLKTCEERDGVVVGNYTFFYGRLRHRAIGSGRRAQGQTARWEETALGNCTSR